MDGYPETIFDDLDGEWKRLRRSGLLDQAFARWRRDDARLEAFEDVDKVIGFLADRDADHGAQSEVLLALLTAARDDRRAARVVLHRFVPALKSIAGWDQPFTQADWAAHVVAEAFEVIATYPLERRPRKVAANIAMDVRKRAYALLSDYRSSQADLMLQPFDGGEAIAPDPADRVEAAQLLELGRRRTDLSGDVAQLIVLTRFLGMTVKDVAERLGVPAARLRQRRWRSEQRIREALPVQ